MGEAKVSPPTNYGDSQSPSVVGAEETLLLTLSAS